jgi:hypothetical protein
MSSAAGAPCRAVAPHGAAEGVPPVSGSTGLSLLLSYTHVRGPDVRAFNADLGAELVRKVQRLWNWWTRLPVRVWRATWHNWDQASLWEPSTRQVTPELVAHQHGGLLPLLVPKHVGPSRTEHQKRGRRPRGRARGCKCEPISQVCRLRPTGHHHRPGACASTVSSRARAGSKGPQQPSSGAVSASAVEPAVGAAPAPL